MPEEEIFFEDLLEVKARRRGVNSGRKGKRGERDLVKVMTARFPDREPFSRVMGSGSHGQRATNQAKNVLTGDLVCPAKFTFCIEAKYGYEDIDLFDSFDGGSKGVDKFLAQAEADAASVGKSPLLCWKKPRSHWLAFTKKQIPACEYSMCYREWNVVTLDWLLRLPDNFFFEDGDGTEKSGQGDKSVD